MVQLEDQDIGTDLRRTFDWMADRYLEQTKRVSRQLYPRWMEHVMSAIGEFRPHSVADVGCGPGYLLELLAHATPDVHVLGVDYAENMLKHVPASIPTVHQSLEDWSEDDDTAYDVTAMTFVLRDQPDPVTALTQLRRRLAPSGHLVFLETHTPEERWKRRGFELYFHRLVPMWGDMHWTPDWPGIRDSAPYRRLSETHRVWANKCPLPDAFYEAGFRHAAQYRPSSDVVMLWIADNEA